MRMALVLAASALVAACSSTTDGDARRDATAAVPSDTPRSTSAAAPAPTSRPAVGPPAAGAPVEAVIAFVEAGRPADTDGFHSASRDGAPADLGEDIAFTSPSGTTRCMTFARTDATLDCLVELTDPPAAPSDIAGQWVGDWVDFVGPTLDVGSVHADPGPFSRGDGPPLPYGESLKFGDFRCRTDPAGLFCVNYAHRTAARIGDAGVAPFGCLRETPPPPDVGVRYACPD